MTRGRHDDATERGETGTERSVREIGQRPGGIELPAGPWGHSRPPAAQVPESHDADLATDQIKWDKGAAADQSGELDLDLDEVGDHLWRNYREYLSGDGEGRRTALWVERTPEEDPKFAESPNRLAYYDGRMIVLRRGFSPEETVGLYVHERLHQLSHAGLRTDRFLENCQTDHRGLRENVFTAGGKLVTVRNQTVNEGLTEWYASQERNRLGIQDMGAYPQAVYLMAMVEKAVGAEELKQAYFKGQPERLEETFNQALGNDEAWWFFSRLADKASGLTTEQLDVPDDLLPPRYDESRPQTPAEAELLALYIAARVRKQREAVTGKGGDAQ